ncbi:MAG TPA: hypothetical protein VFH61_17005, partial [Thermoleophilia bacterium]|nr:hypothetical protein [Thermoleophilia bacterium]
VAEVREAVVTFVEFHNPQWLAEKRGFLNPSATRALWRVQHGMEVAAQDRSVSRDPGPVREAQTP